MNKQVPRVKPSQRMKKRYILFSYKKGACFEEVKALLFSLGVKPLSLIEFDSNSGKGIVRCERSCALALRKALEDSSFKPLRASGSIKKLRQLR